MAAPASHSVRIGQAEEVPYDDLDIDSMAGARTLYERMSMAVRELCEHFRAMDSLYEDPFKRCYAKTMSDAVARVGNATMRRVHDEAKATQRGYQLPSPTRSRADPPCSETCFARPGD
jgi:UrcA family protein